jgi:hypothetical protein
LRARADPPERVASAESIPIRMLRAARTATLAGRAGELVRRLPLVLAVLLGLGVLLRVLMWLAYHPAVLNVPDTAPYVNMAQSTLFSDPVRASGYSMFLVAVHAVTDDLDVTIAIQHLIGIATALLLYGAVRRLGAPVWVGAVAAAAVLLSLDQVLVEHTPLSEAQFTFLLVATIYAGIRSLDEPERVIGPVTSRHAWIAASGVALALAAWTRGVALPAIPFLAVWFVFAMPGRLRVRLARGAIAVAVGALLILAYAAWHDSATGYFGLSQASGRAIYARAAEFADCDQFEPPAGTAALCESTPPELRPGPDFYTWEQTSPAFRLFGYLPGGDSELGEFGRAAILGQPLDYLEVVTRDAARFFAPSVNSDRPYSGTGYDYLRIDRRDPPIEYDLQARLSGYYPDEEVVISDSIGTLADAQQILRVHPELMLVAAALGLVGIVLSRGRVRSGLVLTLGAGLVLILITAAVGTYNARYAIPLGGPLVAAGAVGLWVLVGALRNAPGSGDHANGLGQGER